MSTLEKFHYQITGTDPQRPDKPKLVFIHGTMGFAANWRRIAKAFEPDFEILVYDQRGHGRSFQPAIGYGADDYAGDLREILDALGWSKIHLVGHSLGGRVAFHFASASPERVTRLVIEDIGPATFSGGSSLVTRMLDAVPVPFATKRAAKDWFDTKFMEIFANEYKKEGLAAYLYANLTENDQKQAVWRFFEPGIRESILRGREDSLKGEEVWETVESLTMPTLLVRGELSKDLPRELYEEVLRRNPRIEGVEIKGSGHWIHSDQPDLFIDVVARFFRSEAQIATSSLEPFKRRALNGL